MEIFFKNEKLAKQIQDEKERRRAFGVPMSQKIALRLEALAVAENLHVFWPPQSPPERCHELIGDRAGTFSVDVKQPYRLLFIPIEDPPAADDIDQQDRWKTITAIEIVSIEDTHG